MSGAVKSVKKVFKKVTKSVIGKVVIGAAAAFLTMGLGSAALGAMGASSAFVNSTMGTVLSGAISGAAAGGLTSALTGGDIGKGLLFGGVGGAVVGGLKSALGMVPEGAAAGGAPDASSAANAAQNVGPLSQNVSPDAIGQAAVGSPQAFGAGPTIPAAGDALGQAQAGATGAFGSGPAAAAAASPVQTASQGLLGWLERNQTLAGSVISGVGAGMMGAAKADSDQDVMRLAMERDEAERAARRASHDGVGTRGLLTDANLAYMDQQPQRPTPTQRFDPISYRGEYVYDANLGRIVFVPTGQA